MKGERGSSVDLNLNSQLMEVGLQAVSSSQQAMFSAYMELILRWNARTNLTAVRTPAEIQSRHFIESIACAQNLPTGIASLMDFGSGAGFPGIPIAICCPHISVTLVESQTKKAAFLQEVLRCTGVRARVIATRAETICETFDCVTLRAVDRMQRAVTSASRLICKGGFLAVMTTKSELPLVVEAAGEELTWLHSVNLPKSIEKILAIGRNQTRS